MNSSDQILIVDVNVIIHLEKVGLLDELIKDKNIRIVDLVLYEEYEILFTFRASSLWLDEASA